MCGRSEVAWTNEASESLSTFTPQHESTQRIDIWTMCEGTKVVARPVLPHDEPMLRDVMERASIAK